MEKTLAQYDPHIRIKRIPEAVEVMQKGTEVAWEHNGHIFLKVAISGKSRFWFQLNHMEYHFADSRIRDLQSHCIQLVNRQPKYIKVNIKEGTNDCHSAM